MRPILLIDDDVELGELLAAFFSGEGFECKAVHDGPAGISEALSGIYSIVILDVMLPGCSGFDALREIRAKSRVPVLMLTARGEHVDRIVGLEMGADDYVPKPFNTRELAARVRAVLRRTGTAGDDEGSEEIGDLSMNTMSRSVSIEGHPVELTGTEFRLLELLMLSAGHIVPLDRISREVLGRGYSAFDRSIGVHVSNLRRKIGPYSDGSERIRNIRGEGYVLVFPGRSGCGQERDTQ
ncbi:Transcriptional regulatory protein CpxR [bioreactor metagenome]|uniref:Transcriptional regulatory protein CpxR n=1 Tax=bioreactor metagenome TaxID=1076179 RepID=A0A644ZI97_9ZZZZ|nr:response regulator transcription factor [Aminivibrio sp.]